MSNTASSLKLNNKITPQLRLITRFWQLITQQIVFIQLENLTHNSLVHYMKEWNYSLKWNSKELSVQCKKMILVIMATMYLHSIKFKFVPWDSKVSLVLHKEDHKEPLLEYTWGKHFNFSKIDKETRCYHEMLYNLPRNITKHNF